MFRVSEATPPFRVGNSSNSSSSSRHALLSENCEETRAARSGAAALRNSALGLRSKGGFPGWKGGVARRSCIASSFQYTADTALELFFPRYSSLVFLFPRLFITEWRPRVRGRPPAELRLSIANICNMWQHLATFGNIWQSWPDCCPQLYRHQFLQVSF